jgi:hypothetical protein
MRTLIAFGAGAAAMYLLDPEQGRRRRALLRAQLVHARRVLSARTSGLAAEARRTPESAQQLGR